MVLVGRRGRKLRRSTRKRAWVLTPIPPENEAPRCSPRRSAGAGPRKFRDAILTAKTGTYVQSPTDHRRTATAGRPPTNCL